ncbi:WD40/YVTN/BNR-like repeat-containing protein [candidate division CSSED10-310 bacterium]|uniref:WD40/YVTN/BNR-like repeat-containing protein n=1 Tax=candidate division CSSED10-310 bacterium TaxID=2855610 RepID=A0ABV6Z297_UNCC1
MIERLLKAAPRVDPDLDHSVFVCGKFFLVFLLMILTMATRFSFAEGQLTYHGPHGGDIQTILVDNRLPGRVLVGTSEGGLFYSLDHGSLWQRSRRPLEQPGLVIETIIQGTGTADFYAGIRHQRGHGDVWRSQDGGRSFRAVNEQTLPPIRALVMVKSKYLFVGTTTGLWRSENEGKTWTKVFIPKPHPSVASLAINPHKPDYIYLGTWRRAYRSDNGGRTFSPIWPKMAVDSHVFDFIFHPDQPDLIYAATCGWVYRSNHGGDNWYILKNGLKDRRILSLALSSKKPENLYAGTPSGLFISHNNGQSWTESPLSGQAVKALAFDDRVNTLFVGCDGKGIYKSNCQELKFQTANNGLLSSRIEKLVTTGSTLFLSVPAGNNQVKLYYGPDYDPLQSGFSLTHNIGRIFSLLPAAVSGKNNVNLLLGTSKGLFRVTNPSPGREQESLAGIKIRKLVRDPHRPENIFAATSKGVYRSPDGGGSWQNISPSAYHGECLDLLMNRIDPQSLYLMTLIGIFYSPNQGQDWENYSHNLPKSKTTCLVQDPHDTDHFLVKTMKGLYKSVDAGQNWEHIVAYGFPSHSSFLLFHPHQAGVIFANDLQNGGLFRSRNAGLSWSFFEDCQRFRILAAHFSQTQDQNRPLSLYLGTFGSGLISVALNDAPTPLSPIVSEKERPKLKTEGLTDQSGKM